MSASSLHHQDRFAAQSNAINRRFRQRQRIWCRTAARQTQPHGGAVANLAVDLDVTQRLLDEQAQLSIRWTTRRHIVEINSPGLNSINPDRKIGPDTYRYMFGHPNMSTIR
jgi:hypothetical protein